MSTSENPTGFRLSRVLSLIAGAGSILFGIGFIAFIISIQIRAGFDLPQVLVGIVAPGLLILLGAWVFFRPRRWCLILNGVLLLLFGGFLLSAVFLSNSEQPIWTLPMGIALLGLSVLSFGVSTADSGPTKPETPEEPKVE